MLQRKESLKGYASLTDIIEECKRKGIKVPLNSLKWRIDNGKFSGVRDTYDIRKRRLVPVEEIPNIILYYSLWESIKNGKYYSLSKLAKDIGLKDRSLHPRADKLGIITIKIGNRRIMEKREYDKWRIILTRKKQKENDCVTTGFVGKLYGVSRYLIIYRIKRGEIPATKEYGRYLISKKDFKENEEEWKKQRHYLEKGNKV